MSSAIFVWHFIYILKKSSDTSCEAIWIKDTSPLFEKIKDRVKVHGKMIIGQSFFPVKFSCEKLTTCFIHYAFLSHFQKQKYFNLIWT